MHRTRITWALGIMWCLAAGHAQGRREALLPVSEGRRPTDTGSDGLTKFTLEKHDVLGAKVLKVVFAPGDSFGDRISRVADWKPFVTLEFEAFNPAKENVSLTLTVKHARTTGYPTRVDAPIVLKPGRNAVRLGIDELKNVNGTLPDLTAVQRWYLACAEGQRPTLYFGDIRLVGPDVKASAPRAAKPPGKLRLNGAYRVTGRIGDLTVDLLITPLGRTAEPAAPTPRTGATPPRAPRSDPARLRRIRAAKMPKIARPVAFHTPEADAVCSALEVFPPDNPWNLLVDDWPLHPNSDAIIASIGTDKPFRCNMDMGFVLVPPDQQRVDVKIDGYPDESDPGPYPVPDGVPIEGWPVHGGPGPDGKPLTLADVQRDKLNRGGDRHAIVVDPARRMLYEFFVMKRTDAGWQAQQASIFDLKTNELRPRGWTSADAAGLPIFPAVVRHDELKRGLVEHAMRVTVRKTRRAFVHPARHFASKHTSEDYPRMGERIRLRKDFDVSGFSPPVRAILKGLKRYGMFVADNGIEWAISVAPDPRIPTLHAELRRVKGAAFEVVVPPK